jgi:uncharacterized membrane protein
MGRFFPSEKLLRMLAAAVGVIGLGVASYIMLEQVRGNIPPCGDGGGGCETVLTSPYAELFGIRLYVLGVAGYISILAATAIGGDRGRVMAFVLSFFGFGISVYLTYLQYVVIESICLWCRASAIAMTVLFVLCLARMLGYYGSDHDPSEGWQRLVAEPGPEDSPPGTLR